MALSACALVATAGAQVPQFAGNAQRTNLYTGGSQSLNRIKWTQSIDQNNTGQFAHYGQPLVSAANTVFAPVKIAGNGFQVTSFNGATGASVNTFSSDYILPTSNWIAVFQPVLTTGQLGQRMYYAGAGGTIFSVDNPDSASPGPPVRLVFYTDIATYTTNASGYNGTIFVNSPITADSQGNIFFSFRTQGTAPAPLNTIQSGYVRIDSLGNATYVLADAVTADPNVSRFSHNVAAALSTDEQTLYTVAKGTLSTTAPYLVGLDTTTLATKFKVALHDPRNANNASIPDDSTASPMVAPDGDVYMGVMANPGNGSRGFLLRFSGDLAVEKTPGGFGWDYTPGLVPASMVPSYTGASSYLLFAKYNNYSFADGNGVNRIALLDPNETQIDPHSSSNGLIQMREVFTIIGPTRDNAIPSNPIAVREWCINAPAVDQAGNSIIIPCEDGKVYRWDLSLNSLTQAVTLNAGLGQPYVPTAIGPDGTTYVLNGGLMFAVGAPADTEVSLTSSSARVTSGVTGQSIVYTAMVRSSIGTPSGTFTFTSTTLNGLTPETTVLAADVPIDANGVATVSTSAHQAGGSYLGNHHVTAQYSGDSNFAAASSSLFQKVHAFATTTSLTSSQNPAGPGAPVTLTATVSGVDSGGSVPTGMVTIRDGNQVLLQKAVDGAGVVTFETSSLGLGSHNLTATYASDWYFADSSASLTQDTVAATSTSAVSSPNPSTYGQAVDLTATVTSASGVPTGSVTFTEGVTTLGSAPVNGSGVATLSVSSLAVGAHSLTATFTGTGGFQNSSGAFSHSVTAGTTTTVTTSGSPSNFGSSVTFTATVAGPIGSGTPVGTVTFKEGATVLSSGPVNGSGQATFSTSSLSVGSHTITAEFVGTGGWGDSNGNVAQSVQASTSTGLASSLNPSNVGVSVTFTATVTSSGGTPTGTVTFKDGATTIGTATVNGSGQAAFSTSALTRGVHSITATFAGSGGYLNSASGTVSQTVNAPTVTAVTSAPSPSTVGQSVTFTATVTSPSGGTPTGTVVFTEGATTLATVAVNGSGQASFSTSTLAVGSHTVVASFTGTNNYLNSSQSRVQVVNADTTPPSVPTGLVAVSGPAKGQVRLTWNASTDSGSGMNRYEIWSSTKINTGFSLVGTSTTTTYTDSPGRNKVKYYYIIAVDNAGNKSAASAKVQGTGLK